MGAQESRFDTRCFRNKSPYDENQRHQEASASAHHAGAVTEASATSSSSPSSSSCYTEMLLHLFNRPTVPLSYVRRITLLESIRRMTPTNQNLTEAVMEAILTSPTLSPREKDLIVTEGLLEKRWDRVLCHYTPSAGCEVADAGIASFNVPFLDYRRMVLIVFRKSRKINGLPETSRKRLKAMILRASTHAQLDDFLMRVVERTCGQETKARILDDITSNCYYRLLLPDRFDCYEEGSNHLTDRGVSGDEVLEGDKKPPPSSSISDYGVAISLPDGDNGSIYCPICLDPVQSPAIQLTSCQHVFCSGCINDWIQRNRQMHPVADSSFAGRRRAQQNSNSTRNVSAPQGSWYCPVCRKSYK